MVERQSPDAPEPADRAFPRASAWPPLPAQDGVASLILLAFTVTFVLARVVVLLIMTHRIPSLYLHVSGTHIHHLNYGIFILSAVGAVALVRRPQGRVLTATAAMYGIGLALTFDEFGMWMHLGGPYWQRASFDAVVVIGALLGLYSAGPSIVRRLSRRHWLVTTALVLVLVAFGFLLADSWRYAARRLSPIFQEIEAGSPP